MEEVLQEVVEYGSLGSSMAQEQEEQPATTEEQKAKKPNGRRRRRHTHYTVDRRMPHMIALPDTP